MKKIEIEDIINRAKNIHDNKYTYDFTNYKDLNSKILINCPKHGPFYQRVSDHLYGHGCSLCSIEKNTERKRNDLKYIINKANEIHNFFYDYSLLKKNKSMHDRVDIICPNHGKFSLSLHSHINKKRGCKFCSLERSTDNKEKFIEKSNKIHGNFYKYDKVQYTNSKTKVIITCPIHGDFLQRPMDHINSKQGCPVCNESKGEKEIRNILNDLKIEFEPQKSFCDLKFKKCLYFDFYLPYYNTCIEFNGEQHFAPFEIFGGEESFKILNQRDALKKLYCKEKNINLLNIKYLDINIEKIIKDFLFLT